MTHFDDPCLKGSVGFKQRQIPSGPVRGVYARIYLGASYYASVAEASFFGSNTWPIQSYIYIYIIICDQANNSSVLLKYAPQNGNSIVLHWYELISHYPFGLYVAWTWPGLARDWMSLSIWYIYHSRKNILTKCFWAIEFLLY